MLDRNSARRVLERAIHKGGNVGLVECDVATAVERIRTAAQMLRTGLADHAMTLQRASAGLQRIDDGLELAKTSGLTAFVSRAYRERRLAAQAAGRPFMTYASAITRLNRGVAAAGEGGNATPLSLLAQVFGDY